MLTNALVLSELIEADRRREVRQLGLERTARVERERPARGISLLQLLSPIGRLMARSA